MNDERRETRDEGGERRVEIPKEGYTLNCMIIVVVS